MAYRTLEDFFGDIVGKARRGQGISESELAQQVGLSVRQIEQIESYDLTPDDQAIYRLADALHLDGKKTGGSGAWMGANAGQCGV